jgi:hypothetical protein
MFAAAEAHYVDRRLVGNMLQSYFDGPKAGSEEVQPPIFPCLTEACSKQLNTKVLSNYSACRAVY